MPKNKHCLGRPSHKPAPPDKAVWLHIPEHCRMVGQFTADRDIQLLFGSLTDETTVVFERFALERLARLVHELLAVPAYEEEVAKLPVLVSPSMSEDAGAPNLAAGEESSFIRELRAVSKLLEPYVGWVLEPDTTENSPFPFEDQMLLSVRLAALGHAVREAALAWMNEDDEDEAAAGEAGENDGAQGTEE